MTMLVMKMTHSNENNSCINHLMKWLLFIGPRVPRGYFGVARVEKHFRSLIDFGSLDYFKYLFRKPSTRLRFSGVTNILSPCSAPGRLVMVTLSAPITGLRAS